MTLAGTLAAEETAAPVESLDVIARMLREQLGAASVSFLITDFTGGSVVRLGAAGSVETDEPARRITLRDTLYDDVIRTQRPSVEDKGEGALVRIVAPVTDRGDAIGLLELFLPAAPDAEVMRAIGETAHALAYIVIANRSFTDVYQWGRRTTPLSLAAEIQHRLLPASLSCEAAQFAVAGALEPADHVGGDTFDYVIDRDTVQLSVTDAMGHDVDAALLFDPPGGRPAPGPAGRCRPRRAGPPGRPGHAGARPPELRHRPAPAYQPHRRQDRVHQRRAPLATADAGWTGAGDRSGDRYAVRLPCPSQLSGPVAGPAPGDRLVMLTDGMLERNARGLDLSDLIVRTRALHPREAARTLVAAVVDAHHGHLQDDATVMCLDWPGAGQSQQDADTGADLADASARRMGRTVAGR